jgi:hypothetical protein
MFSSNSLPRRPSRWPRNILYLKAGRGAVLEDLFSSSEQVLVRHRTTFSMRSSILMINRDLVPVSNCGRSEYPTQRYIPVSVYLQYNIANVSYK